MADIIDVTGKKMVNWGHKLNYDKVRPLFDEVLVRCDTPPGKTKGGILVPFDPGRTEMLRKGTVIAVGPGLYTADGKITKNPVSPGDRVLFNRNSGVMVDEKKTNLETDPAVLLMCASAVLAVLEKGAEVESE